jgi:hypothetical protein
MDLLFLGLDPEHVPDAEKKIPGGSKSGELNNA